VEVDLVATTVEGEAEDSAALAGEIRAAAGLPAAGRQ